MGKNSMRFLLVVILLSATTAAVKAGDTIPRQPAKFELSSVFRSVRTRPIEPPFSAALRRSPTFGLKLTAAKGEDSIEFVPSTTANESRVEFGDESSGYTQIQDLDVFNHEPSASDLPPMTSSPKPLSTEAIPLDGAPREDGKTTSEENRLPATTRSSFAWIAGTQDKLGLFELDFQPLSRVRFDSSRSLALQVDTTFGARWLQGPDTTDLPPYLFNILINIGMTHQVNDRLTIDAMISPGWYTDFSNKGVEAFRLPWHIVSYYKSNDDWRWVLGVTDLSRQDIRYLPVVGAIYAPGAGDVRWDLVFPKPRVAWRICREDKLEHWLYVGGELGGGSWAISRADRSYDIVTYRDLRLVVGLETQTGKGRASRLEVGWIFDRSVEYQSNVGNYTPPESLMIRVSADY